MCDRALRILSQRTEQKYYNLKYKYDRNSCVHPLFEDNVRVIW